MADCSFEFILKLLCSELTPNELVIIFTQMLKFQRKVHVMSAGRPIVLKVDICFALTLTFCSFPFFILHLSFSHFLIFFFLFFFCTKPVTSQIGMNVYLCFHIRICFFIKIFTAMMLKVTY